MKIALKTLTVSFAVAGLMFSSSCKKDYLDTNPTNQIASEEMFKTTTSARTALNGIHSLMISRNLQSNHAEFGTKMADLCEDMMGNDMVGTGSGYDWFDYHYKYVMQESATYWGPYHFWRFFYRIINNANNILDNIDAAEGSEQDRNDIKGQALAYRGWAYFKLASYFQQTYVGNEDAPGVPIYTTRTTVENSKGAPRGKLSDVYARAVADLEQSITLLEGVPVVADKSQISINAAYGIYARIALTMNNWAKAREMAIRAKAGYAFMTPNQYTAGFNDNNNPEWMWSSNYTSEQYDGQSIINFISFVDQNCPGYAQVGATRRITKALYDQIPATDVRKQVFTVGNVQDKFRAQDPNGFVCDYVYMRVAEMYLIQAEAAARLGNTTEAASILEELVVTRNPEYVAPSTGILNEVLLQRRIELWGEGFAYSDIMRLKAGLNRPSGSGNHSAGVARILRMDPQDSRFIFKIPQGEIDPSEFLGPDDQNP